MPLRETHNDISQPFQRCITSHLAFANVLGKAEQSENNNLQILYGYAASLYEFNDNKCKTRAVSLLRSIVEKKPVNTAEFYIVQQARLKLHQEISTKNELIIN